MKIFRGFHVFVFTYRAKNENVELAENFRNMWYRNLDFLNVNQRASKFHVFVFRYRAITKNAELAENKIGVIFD